MENFSSKEFLVPPIFLTRLWLITAVMSMKMKITRCSIIQSFLWNCCFVFFVANLKWHQFSSKYFLNTHHYWLGAFKLMENSQGPRALRFWFSFRNKGYCYSWLFGKKFHITQSRISQTFLVMLINCSTYWKKKKNYQSPPSTT